MIESFLLASVVLCAFLTGVLRHYALSRNLLDLPNHRSSHSVPTPRGGGVAIVLTTLIGIAALTSVGDVSLPLCMAMVLGGGAVALVGFLDDHGHIAARVRLLIHFISAAVILLLLSGLAPIQVGPIAITSLILRNTFAILYLVWLLNLFNFMDGIDGIASVQVVTTCASASLLFYLSGNHALISATLLLASATFGFFIWNFPPAKIFMGDAGSGFIGIAIGVLSIASSWEAPAYFWAWCILLGVFIVDASYTLMRRLLGGAKIYEAHRSHAYQIAARRFGAHLPVTIVVGLINVFWLLPLAASVVLLGLNGALGALIAYSPLLAIAVSCNAGSDRT